MARSLPPGATLKRMVQLYQFDKLTLAEVAHELGVSIESVRTRLKAEGVELRQGANAKVRKIRPEMHPAVLAQTLYAHYDQGRTLDEVGQLAKGYISRELDRHAVSRLFKEHNLPLRTPHGTRQFNKDKTAARKLDLGREMWAYYTDPLPHTLAQVSRQFRVPERRCSTLIKAAGYTLRQGVHATREQTDERARDKRERDIAKLYQKGMSILAISKEIHMDRGNISDILAKQGVPLRPNGRTAQPKEQVSV